MMKIKSLLIVCILAVLLPIVALGLAGCSGGSSPESSTQDPVAVTSPQPSNDASANGESPAVVDEPAAVPEPPVEEDPIPAIEPTVEVPVDQPVLTWARDAGGLSHCDRMSIFSDGRVEAVVCRARTSQPMVYGTLDEEQLAQVLGWVAEYSPFSRREMGMSSAVSTTQLLGAGSTVPATEEKAEISTFASELFFSLTGTN